MAHDMTIALVISFSLLMPAYLDKTVYPVPTLFSSNMIKSHDKFLISIALHLLCFLHNLNLCWHFLEEKLAYITP